MQSAQRRCIITVDDDEVVLELIERYFTRRLVEVIRSQTPLGISRLYSAHRPAVIVLDVNMPALSGDKLAELIRKVAEDVPIVFYSSIDEAQGRQLSRRFPGSRFVSKADGVVQLWYAIEPLLPAPFGGASAGAD